MWVSPNSAAGQLEALAAELCAVVLTSGNKVRGHYIMDTEDARDALHLGPAEFALVMGRANHAGWVSLSFPRIELKAAGIYVAKVQLDLPR